VAQGGKRRIDVLVQGLFSLQGKLRALVDEHEHQGLVNGIVVMVDYLDVVVVGIDNIRLLVVLLNQLLPRGVLFRHYLFIFAAERTFEV